MDTATVACLMWPQGGQSLHSADWCEKLHVALKHRVGREPTAADVMYRSSKHNKGGEVYCTTVTITVAETNYKFTGADETYEKNAMRCVAWVALMSLCTDSVLKPPPYT